MITELTKYAQSAYSNTDTIQNTYDLSTLVIQNNISGDFVECGVAAGAQIGVMGHVCKKFNSKKKIYAYDSYQGIPLAGKEDTDQPGIGPTDPNRHIPENPRDLLVSSGITVHSLQSVKKNISSWGLPIHQYVFIEGWFQDTVPLNNIEQISLLRLDGDLYESTKVCLEHFHHKVSPGGYVIIDDYALTGARVAVHEYFDKHGLKYEPIPVCDKLKEVHWYQVK